MKLKPEMFDASIVVIGDFAPSMFSPDWLQKHNLIGSEDGEAIKQSPVFVNSQQLSVLENELFRIDVLPNRFQVTSKGAVSPAIRDLVAGVLTLNPAIPVTSFGINFTAHYRLNNAEDYHKIGDTLAPKAIWSNVFPESGSVGLLDLTVAVYSHKRTDKPITGNVTKVIVQPSGKIVPNGVFFNFNNHQDVTSAESKECSDSEYSALVIQRDWETSMEEARRVFAGIITAIVG